MSFIKNADSNLLLQTYCFSPNNKTPVIGNIMQRSVTWFRADKESRDVQIWGRIVAIAIAIYLRFHSLESLYFYCKRWKAQSIAVRDANKLIFHLFRLAAPAKERY
jgi:hypothetical protein